MSTKNREVLSARRESHWPRTAVLLLAALLLLACCGCNRAPISVAQTRPNIVLITLDGLGASRLALYGGTAKMPNLERLAAEGVAFDNAFSQSDDSLYSSASLLGSQYPSELAPLVPELFVLRADQLTLPKILTMYGYTCAGFHGDPRLDDKHGFGAGFAKYEGESHCASLSHLATPAAEWARGKPGPLFLYLQSADLLDRKHIQGDDVSAVDSFLVETISQLAKVGVDASNTLFVIGAACGDKGGTPDAALHVPLVLWGAGVSKRGAHAAGVVQNVDLLPTLLATGGVVVPSRIRGRDLNAQSDGYAYGETATYAAALQYGRYMLVASGAPAGSPKMIAQLQASKSLELYDLGAHKTLDDPAISSDLQKKLLNVERDSVAVRQQAQKTMDPKLREELRRHGYW